MGVGDALCRVIAGPQKKQDGWRNLPPALDEDGSCMYRTETGAMKQQLAL